jgi:hypothetical protein
MAEIRRRAAADSPLWAQALLPGDAPEPDFAGRCPATHLLGVEMIREGYLLHRGRSRLFGHDDDDLALLTGDYLYAAGLVEICRTGDLDAVVALAELISHSSRDLGEGDAASGEQLWGQTVGRLGQPDWTVTQT